MDKCLRKNVKGCGGCRYESDDTECNYEINNEDDEYAL